MEVNKFISILQDMGVNLYTGVPDSLLKSFTDVIERNYGVAGITKQKNTLQPINTINITGDKDKQNIQHNIQYKHIVAANEGAAVGLAAGHYLATGKPAAVYMQNSGIGNAVNPICSLLHKKVYSIPVIFVVGWRGEPGIKDEPQHVFQGEITLKQLELLEIPYVILQEGETIPATEIDRLSRCLKNEQSIAFVIRKNGLTEAVNVASKLADTAIAGTTITDSGSSISNVAEPDNISYSIANCVPIKNPNCHCGLDPQSPEINMGFRVGAHSDKYIEGHNSNPAKQSVSKSTLSREGALKTILEISGESVCVCSTGKLSREVFEIREKRKDGHKRDFLTVGSMGHSISIAHGIANAKPDKRVLCLDGDGAALMHMGSLAVTGVCSPDNLVHIVINNGVHETVGGMPNVCDCLNLSDAAKTFGYKTCLRLKTAEEIRAALNGINQAEGTVFIEILSNTASRKDLGRPTTTPAENKAELMEFLSH